MQFSISTTGILSYVKDWNFLNQCFGSVQATPVIRGAPVLLATPNTSWLHPSTKVPPWFDLVDLTCSNRVRTEGFLWPYWGIPLANYNCHLLPLRALTTCSRDAHARYSDSDVLGQVIWSWGQEAPTTIIEHTYESDCKKPSTSSMGNK